MEFIPTKCKAAVKNRGYINTGLCIYKGTNQNKKQKQTQQTNQTTFIVPNQGLHMPQSQHLYMSSALLPPTFNLDNLRPILSDTST